MKRPTSRSSRSRGFKLKHALQICLLLGVCFWLVYQVKHSHAKKEELDTKDAKLSVKTQDGNPEVNLGRKSLHPRVDEEKNEADEDEETAVEEDESKLIEKQVLDDNKQEGDEREEDTGKSEGEAEDEETKNEKDEENSIDKEDRDDGNKSEEEMKDGENKHEEELRDEENNGDDEEQEEETKSDRTVEEGREVAGDEIDEHDQPKIEGDADHDENLFDEEKEREEIAENESRNEEGETGKEGQVDREASAEDQDKNAENHEAREKHYTGDDASSAVTHDTQIVSNELENPSSNSSNEHAIPSNLEQDKDSTDIKDISKEQNSMLELSDVKTEEQLPKNATNEQQFVEDKPVASGSTEIPVTYDMDKPQNETVGGTETSNLKSTELEPNSTSTVSDKTENTETVAEDINSSTNLELDVSNSTIRPELIDPEVDSGLSRETEETRNENLDQNGSDGADESSGLATSDGAGDGDHDVGPIDTTDASIGQDEKEARIDLDTLPENIVEGVHSRDAAAE